MTNYSVKSGSRQNIQNTRDAIRERTPFKTSGSLHGGMNEGTIGTLYRASRDKFYEDANKIDYVVYSYLTPIAWHTTDNQWTIVTSKFSVTTTTHQSTVRAALNGRQATYGLAWQVAPLEYTEIRD